MYVTINVYCGRLREASGTMRCGYLRESYLEIARWS